MEALLRGTVKVNQLSHFLPLRTNIWLRRLLKNIDAEEEEEITIILMDNQSAIKAKNPEFHKRNKHIDIRFHFIREKLENKEINIQ